MSRVKELARAVQEMHRTVYEELLHASVDVREVDAISLESLAETAYFAKEIGMLCKDLQVEADRLSALYQKLACACWVVSSQDSVKIETEDFIAEPDLKMSANIPSHTKDPEAYNAMLQWFGVPKEICETGQLRVHWPSFKELLTERQQQGLPLPPGVSPDKTHAHYLLKFKPKKASEK